MVPTPVRRDLGTAAVLALCTALAVACQGSQAPIATASTPAPTPAAAKKAAPTPVATPASGPTLAPSPSSAREPTSARALSIRPDKPAADFELSLLDGESLRLSDLSGKVVVLNFWASWCPPCRWEMPAFERTWTEYRDRDVVFLGVAVSDTEEEAQAFAERVGVTYLLGLDSTGQIVRDYRVSNLPTTFFIDRQGKITRKLASAANEAALRIFLESQLKKG